MTIERLKELETSLARAYSISGDPELVDVDEHARCYEDIQKLIEREIERQQIQEPCPSCNDPSIKVVKETQASSGRIYDKTIDHRRCPNCGRRGGMPEDK